MTTYDVFTIQDFEKMVESFRDHFKKRELKGLKFPKIKIIAKSWIKDKTPSQHKYYFYCITEMQKAFKEVGSHFEKTEIHEFVKKRIGYTKLIVLPDGTETEVTRSIADKSEDVNSNEVRLLTEFVKQWTASELNYIIKDAK